MKTKINAFKGLRYSSLKIKNFADVVAPPYDVIDENLRTSLSNRHENNVVKLILSQPEGNLDKYQVAAKLLQDWQKQEVLLRDASPQIYIYHQTYSLADGRKLTRKGFIVRRRLESFDEGSIRPHEYTFAGPKADRMQLTKATQTNLSPIFGVFSDPGLKVQGFLESFTQQSPLMDLTTDEGNNHKLWAVGDEKTHQQVDEAMQKSVTFIADGHHRYETALGYRDFLRAQGQQNTEAGSEFVLMYLCPMEDAGLVILPTHRVIDAQISVDLDKALSKLSSEFKISAFEKSQKDLLLQKLTQLPAEKALGFVLATSNKLLLLQISLAYLEKVSTLSSIKKEVRELDVTVLHKYLLPEIFGIELHEGDEFGKIHYVKDTQEAFAMAEQGKASISFILNPTQMKQVEEVSNIGERMPHKSTFFYPKLLSGLVFNPLD